MSYRVLTPLLASALAVGCARTTPLPQPAAPVPASAPTQTAAAPMTHEHHMDGMSMTPIVVPTGANYTKADVEFMQGMIAHHAQAIYMSRMAASHLANPRLVRFATKIDQSQITEIRLMQRWLTSNNQTAPDTGSWRTMSMPGMLTAQQVDELDKSRGTDFEKHFLVYMIQHHEGAIRMVDDLFKSPRAGQEVDVNVFANDVVTVQTAEIELMRQMLADY